MPPTPSEDQSQVKEWVNSAFKGLVVCIFSMFTFFVNQLNGSISSLTAQLKSMEIHQVDTDKRVAAIEISREVNMEAYKKVVGDVQKSMTDIQDIKSQIAQNSMRLQTIADFVAKRVR